MVIRLHALAVSSVALALSTACGTDAVGVESCRKVEEARCRQAPSCGIPLEPPYHTSGNDVGACIRFYDDACLHGLEVSDPGPTAVNACVAAIQSNGCGVVKAPETAPDAACAWLVPPASAPSSDAAPEAASEAGDAPAE